MDIYYKYEIFGTSRGGIKMCECKENEPCTCNMSYMGYHREHKKKHHHYAIFEISKDCDHKKEKCHPEKEECPHEKEKCSDSVKGYNLCGKKIELRCFKHCEPISQPCDESFYNYFTSRTNFEFSGLIVITNTGNPTSGCSMQVGVTDRVGTAIVATVSPGASVPIFVEGITSLDIACFDTVSPPPLPSICSGEIIFDLEYCTSRAIF